MGSLHDLIQFIFAGLTGGAIYALVALGFGVVHNTMGIVNFTQVDFVSLGGMLLYSALLGAGLPMAPALLAAVAGVTLVAMLVEVAGIGPSRSDSHLVLIFLTIGLSIILRGAMTVIWGKDRMAVPSLSGEAPVHVLGATILPQTLWILALTAVAIIGLVLFFRKTSMGLAMRGVAANEAAAAVVGLPVWRVKAASFALAGALGGLAGCLVTPITTLSYDVGVLLGLTARAIIGLMLFFRKTSMGLARRGVAANPEAAAVVGLKVWRVKAMSFALAGALGGLAGCLVTPITTLSYDVGVLLGLKGFAAAILGGFGSFPGAILGGLTLGLLESLGAAYISSAYKDVIAFIVLLLVLFIRPRGLLGRDG